MSANQLFTTEVNPCFSLSEMVVICDADLTHPEKPNQALNKYLH
jgi:hypothetical protein